MLAGRRPSSLPPNCGDLDYTGEAAILAARSSSVGALPHLGPPPAPFGNEPSSEVVVAAIWVDSNDGGDQQVNRSGA